MRFDSFSLGFDSFKKGLKNIFFGFSLGFLNYLQTSKTALGARISGAGGLQEGAGGCCGHFGLSGVHVGQVLTAFP